MFIDWHRAKERRENRREGEKIPTTLISHACSTPEISEAQHELSPPANDKEQTQRWTSLPEELGYTLFAAMPSKEERIKGNAHTHTHTHACT